MSADESSGFQTDSLYLAGGVGIGCLCAQGVLTIAFAKLLPEGGFYRNQPGFLAHQLVALPLMFFVAWVGTRAWFSERDASTPEERVYNRDPTAELLASVLLGSLVLWDIPMTFLPTIYSHASMGHHVGLAALSGLSLTPYMQYYVPFFAGVIEISSVPLQVPSRRGEPLARVEQHCC